MHWIIQKTINFFKKTPENPTALFIEKQDTNLNGIILTIF